MTDEELAAIEQRVQAATQGVELFIGRVDNGDDVVEIHRRDRPDRPPFAEVSTWEALGVLDGEFIVHAYLDVPALLAEVRRLKASMEPSGTFTCKARSGGDPAEPQDCDWPVCGCDEHASKVIAALQECGWDKRSNQP